MLLPKLSKLRVKKVYKTQIINDRGIHIMQVHVGLAKFGNGETPESTGQRNKLVGNYYVKFDKAYKEEIHLMSTGKTEEEAKKQAPIIIEAQKCQKWRQEMKVIKTMGKNESMGL
jgi:arginyl-tRNA synthetase